MKRTTLLSASMLVIFLLGCSWGIALTWAASGGYARAELLAETDWLAQHLHDSDLRIVDMRSESAYRKGHLPGAVYLDWKALKDPDNELYVIPPEKFATLMGQLGIGNGTTVVGY
ncbi:MAG TPA: rhodanese-like domain-containing protein, partial [Candidatus Tectomicrobia bacterium]|nr:rhodanese-like domain-containing protein [Candidatus Tectomicrobia bacterium]